MNTRLNTLSPFQKLSWSLRNGLIVLFENGIPTSRCKRTFN